MFLFIYDDQSVMDVAITEELERWSEHQNIALVLVVSYGLDPSHKSHIALEKYPTMHHFVTEMCTHVHISATKLCIVGYGTGTLLDLCDRFMGIL